ncbi:MAG: peptidase M4 [Methylophaga nitratireducenticrescens]|uniref:PepSY domain-containing protein n=1 Tax=Methylophaga sp. SB9B TaxID=2570356 RepID=UPI0010A81612|nr:PepSY domain-containing protein [Methylophaga sp. SB9B]THF72285.1 MAG: peptidase M4 [Methylophaga nitratireducenticrescens]THK40770.1 peptidase M4 [Methylophaga sp. SB9B]
MKKLLMFTLVSSVISFSAFADDIVEMQTKSEQLGLISVDEAKSIALEAKPGIIDDIDLENRSFFGGWDYEIEVLGKDGKEWDVYVNAETGEVRKVSRDWDWF